jgi:TonB family protein
MKGILLSGLLFCCVITANAQTQKVEAPDLNKIEVNGLSDSSKVKNVTTLDFQITEEKNAADIDPNFPGGIINFYKYLSQNIHYPKRAIKDHIQGEVYLSFVVGKEGHVTNVKVVRGVSAELDAEAVRVIKNSPDWNPGTQNNRHVSVLWHVPISFKL